MVYQPISFFNAPLPKSIQDLMGKEWENAINRAKAAKAPQIIESDLRSAEMLRELQRQQAGHYGALTEKEQQLSPYNVPLAEADLQRHQAEAYAKMVEARKMQQLIDILMRMQGGGQDIGAGGSGYPGGANGAMGLSGGEGNMPGNFIEQRPQSPQQGALSPFEEAIIRHEFGMGQPHATSVGGGRALIYDPLKGYEVQQVGPTVGEEAREKIRGETFGKMETQFADDYKKATSEEQKLEYVLDILERNPNLTGPLNQVSSKYFSDEEKQEIFGTLDSLSKSMVIDMSKVFGSRMTDRDLKFAQSMKIDKAQPQSVLKGRAKTLLAMDRLLKKGSKAARDFIKKHPEADEIDVYEHISEQVNFREEMDKIQKEAKEREAARGEEKITIAGKEYRWKDIEGTANENRMTPEEVIKELEMRGKE